MQQDSLRVHGPQISDIRNVPVPEYEIFYLDNGIPIYYINKGSQDLTRLDIVFEGARHRESQKTLSRAFGSMTKEGTNTLSSAEISAYFDFYGATYNCNISLDFTTFSLFSLTRFFPTLLDAFTSLIFDPQFPKSELKKYIKNSKEKMLMDWSKNEVVAYQKLTENIYGSEDVYGYNSSVSTFDAINKDALKGFHQDLLTHQKCAIFLAGKFHLSLLDVINGFFGKWAYKGDAEILYSPSTFKPASLVFPAPSKLQSAIRMGMPFGSKRHEDYGNISFLNNVFGGFFGSRLMKNIREDKGYTYNIYSDIDTMLMDGYFYIACELDKEYVNPAMEEIAKEMDILKNKPISHEELNMNKNYILGNLLTSVDGPFQAIRMVKSAILNRQTLDDVDQIIQSFINMTPEKVMETANKYLNFDKFLHVLVNPTK